LRILEAIRNLAATAGTKKFIKDEMTERECKRAVKVLARRAIAHRSRFLVSQGWKPGKAFEQARTEYKSQHGGFR
jgi:ribulose bisphosphate carboxylase small subunit